MQMFDSFIGEIDVALRTLLPPTQRPSTRPTPTSQSVCESDLSPSDKKHIAGLMRVNHSGEVCAQALYQGQALTAKLEHVRAQMAKAAREEEDHLAWCEQRLNELGSHPSRLNALWYAGAFCIGALAGAAGDRWSLGFVAETEKQVGEHLHQHMQSLPEADKQSHGILKQMQEDEAQHEALAKQAGAAELPAPVKTLMRMVSKLMTRTAYHI